MDELRTYADRRLELGDMIRSALHLARGSKDEQAEDRARDLLSRLASDTFRLAVAGQFSRGKTTLMNALLGGPYLPMGALPMTSVITRVRYGSHPKAIVRRRASGLGAEVPLAQVARYIAQTSATRAEQQVVSVEVAVPAEILRLGFEFIDTPGVGSAIEINTATTRRFLPQADAVIFVTGFDSPLTQAEAGFLADTARHAGKLFLVLNKRDLVSGQDADAALEFVRHRLREDMSMAGPRIFALSALQALEAVVHGDDGRLAGSGLPDLHAELQGFLATGKTRLFLRNIAGQAATLVAGQLRSLRLGRLALDGGPGPDAVLAAFEARMAGLDRQRSVLAGTIADRIEAGLPGLLAARSPDWPARLLELLGPLADDAWPADEMDGPVRDLLEKARERLERASQEVVGGWLARRTGEVLEMVTATVAGEVGSLLELARSPGMVGAELAGLADVDDRRELAGWSAEDVPDLAVRPLAWTVQVEQPRRSRRKAGSGDAELRARLDAALVAAVDAFTDRVRIAFAEAAREWARRLDEQAERQMRRAADWFRRCVRTVPSEEDLAAADRLIVRLAAFQAALEGAEPSPAAAVITPPAGSPDTAAEGCTICDQMEQALTSYLFSGQFRLATREDEQERHSLGRGFCPLHTWQYAAVGSPLGISAGYAKLAASVADALESLSRPDSTPADLARGVAALTAGPGSCPVCAALADRERTAMAGLVSRVPPTTAALCLRHLARALSAGLEATAARASLHALAAALRRDSEDMRTYALKREAYRSALVTAEESRAHLDALRKLAGPPGLTQPWTDQDSARAWS
ncbi:MAG TPA: dynamin family protein [Streptosporangiaceae bacterium]|nr:dynamin family protein [Streptosporangiaceae bacterium]